MRALVRLLVLAVLLAARTVAGELDDWTLRMSPISPLGYVVRRASAPLTIDGKLDDAAWNEAPWTSDFVDIEGAAKPRPRFRTRAKLLWDDEYLYIAAELQEPHVWATLRQHDTVIFNDPDFEVFIDPDGDTHAYSELEVNAFGTTWDLLLDKPYQDNGSAHNDWEIAGMRAAVEVRGTLNDPSDADVGWTVELALPWRAFRSIAGHEGAPREGEQWRLNFSRVEWQIKTDGGAYRKVPGVPEDNWVWSPQGVIDMHRPEMWGVLQFTRRASTEVALVDPMPAARARLAAFAVYYAERDFRAAHGAWATLLSELKLPDFADVDVSLSPTTDGYECRAAETKSGRGWSIRQDRRLSPFPASPAQAAAQPGGN